MGQTAETGAADQLDQLRCDGTRKGSITPRPNLAAFRSKLHDDDEVIVITGCEPAGRRPRPQPDPGFFGRYSSRGRPLFALRAHVPAVLFAKSG